MRCVSKILDMFFFVCMVPMLMIGLYALVDGILVSESATIEKDIIELAEKGDDEIFDRLEEESPYTVAWLQVEKTNINYPVVQGDDNTWFLNRNYRGDFATAGSLFLDYRNDANFEDVFSIVYGHRMGNGEMFSDVHLFKDESFFREHKTGRIKKKSQNVELEVVAYAEVKANDWSIYNVKRSRNNIGVVQEIVKKAIRRSDGDVIVDGKYVLFSTCDAKKKEVRDVLL